MLRIACYWYSAVVCLSWKSLWNLVVNPVFIPRQKFHAKENFTLLSKWCQFHSFEGESQSVPFLFSEIGTNFTLNRVESSRLSLQKKVVRRNARVVWRTIRVVFHSFTIGPCPNYVPIDVLHYRALLDNSKQKHETCALYSWCNIQLKPYRYCFFFYPFFNVLYLRVTIVFLNYVWPILQIGLGELVFEKRLKPVDR